jgi:hypothetical protein
MDLKIPDPEGGRPLWPPPQPNLALGYLATMPPDPFIASEAAKGVYLEERNRRVLEDNRRQIAEFDKRQAEFEARQAAEARKAQEATVHGHVRRSGCTHRGSHYRRHRRATPTGMPGMGRARCQGNRGARRPRRVMSR